MGELSSEGEKWALVKTDLCLNPSSTVELGAALEKLPHFSDPLFPP